MARISSPVTILARHAASTTRCIASKTAIGAPWPMPKMNRGRRRTTKPVAATRLAKTCLRKSFF
eukprot:8932145-Alexandrium_andersonii.AAC.1